MNIQNLEYISIENQTTAFPKHFHNTFCISLIHKGVEQIDFENQSLFSEAGSISITNPYEVHSNPLFDANIKFDTIYIPNELMKQCLDGKNIEFINKKIKNKKLNNLFTELKNALDTQNSNEINNALLKFTNALKCYSEENKTEFADFSLHNFIEVNKFIETNIIEKFSLTALAKIANINKYGFAKKFKASTGMSPMNYILMKKIFSIKKLVTKNTDFTDLAYQYNFTDLPHFSKTFKRFVGVSPKTFQERFIKK